MRKHNPIHSFHSFNADVSSRRNEFEFWSSLNLTNNHTDVEHTFISCKWISCTGNSGGGIYYQKSDSRATLTIKKGEFYLCKATVSRGGGVYVDGINTIIIEETLFHTCTAAAQYNAGGGGVEIVSLQSAPNIEQTSFL